MANVQDARHPLRVPTTEHPEDRKAREEGEGYGRKHAAEFIAAHPTEVAWLLGTYPDSEAHEVLDSLRERFWGGMWSSTAGRKFERLPPTKGDAP